MENLIRHLIDFKIENGESDQVQKVMLTLLAYCRLGGKLDEEEKEKISLFARESGHSEIKEIAAAITI